MSQIVENWTDISGTVEQVTHGDGGDVTLHVRVSDARAVGGFANLLADHVGDVVAIRVRGAQAPPAGAAITCRVRKAGVDRVFADETSLRLS